jgi:hypothetical protein
MGFGIFWNMQFHFSWILLPPFVLCALLLRWRAGQRGILREAVGFLVGAAFPAAFLVPTLFKYGFLTGKGGLSLFQSFNGHNFLSFFDILARFFSLASYELLRFLELPHLTGSGTAARIAFCKSVPWIIPPVLFLILTGWIQPLALFIGGWFKDIRHPEAKPFQRLTLGALLLVWASFWFTSKPPSAHIYYILLPLILIYSFYIGARLAAHHKWRALGVACLVANLWFESGYMWQMMRIQSLYVNRAKVIQAIHERNYHVLGERRPGSLY